jgi:predicted peptidase
MLSGISWAQQAFIQKHLFISNGNDTLPYRLIEPVNKKASVKYPLVLFLHGSVARGNDNEAPLRQFPALFTDSLNRVNFPCYVLIPQCPKKDAWVMFPGFPHSLAATDTPTRACRLTLEMIDKLARQLQVDQDRIYITGLSLGGEGTFDFIARRPSLFAAAMPLCAVADTAQAKRIAHIPLWVFHGDEDAVNPVEYSQMMVMAIEKQGGQPVYTEYKGVKHNCWVQAYREPGLLPWLFSQKRVSKPRN